MEIQAEEAAMKLSSIFVICFLVNTLFAGPIITGKSIVESGKVMPKSITVKEGKSLLEREMLQNPGFETGLLSPWSTNNWIVDTYWAGNGITFDNRNQPVNPQQGIYAQLTNRIGRKMIRYQAAQLVANTYFESEMVLPFSAKLNLAFLLNGRNLYASDTVSYYDLFHLGGARSLRGYPEDAFSSTRIFWLNNELRWRLGTLSRIFPFYDIGSYLNDNRYEIKMGYGLGLRVWSKIGLFGIDYGLAFGENPLNGKVHLTLTNQF